MTGADVQTFAATLDSLHEVREYLASRARQLGIEPGAIADLQLAVDEAVTNIIVHGYRGASGNILIGLRKEKSSLAICLRDDAPLFDPTKNRRPDLEVSPLEKETPGGYGVELVRRLVDELHYRVVDQCNELTLVKKV